jgi:hypothetical protein
MTVKELLSTYNSNGNIPNNIPMWLDIEDISEYVSAECLYHGKLTKEITLGKFENLPVRNWSIRMNRNPTLYIEISLPNSSYLK